MSDYSLIYVGQVTALVVAMVMIFMARRAFNGLAVMLISLGGLLVIRRIDDTTGLIGDVGMAVVSSLVVALYCIEAWKIWKDRRDHADWLHWREQWARELKLIQEWQTRRAEWEEKERILEAMREPSDNLSPWGAQWEIADRTRKIKRRANG